MQSSNGQWDQNAARVAQTAGECTLRSPAHHDLSSSRSITLRQAVSSHLPALLRPHQPQAATPMKPLPLTLPSPPSLAVLPEVLSPPSSSVLSSSFSFVETPVTNVFPRAKRIPRMDSTATAKRPIRWRCTPNRSLGPFHITWLMKDRLYHRHRGDNPSSMYVRISLS